MPLVQEPIAPPPPDVHDLFVRLTKLALYEKENVRSETPNLIVRGLRLHEAKFDAYCNRCGKSSTWKAAISADLTNRKYAEENIQFGSGGRYANPTIGDWMGSFRLQALCSRDHDHTANFYFETLTLEPESRKKESGRRVALVKVGQWPSLTDFQIGDLAEFEDGMTKDQRKEFVRAINTAAHGFSVAACVYYRRIFEGVLADAKKILLAARGPDALPDFDRLRTDEKIAALRDFLPPFMAEHPHIYGILSKGVHELTEEECAAEMPTLREAIELIMHERVEEVRKQKRKGAASRLLAQSVNRLK
jgi:hypothetical protein